MKIILLNNHLVKSNILSTLKYSDKINQFDRLFARNNHAKTAL